MDKLDRIPWKGLTHAYGPAEDVPDLLRALRTVRAEDTDDEDSPLWHLFGNIWHQGTVYQATSYAVPFLLELVEDVHAPNRVGVLGLLGAIAHAESDRPEWAAKAHDAVSEGFDTLVRIAYEGSDASLGAAYVVAQLRERVTEVCPVLRRLLEVETCNSRRVGLILLLGHLGDRSDTVFSILSDAASSGDTTQRRAAAVSFARLRPDPLPAVAREAIIEAITAEGFEVEGLPWDAAGEVETYMQELLACLDTPDLDAVTDTLIAAVESGSSDEFQVWRLLDLLFPIGKQGVAPRRKASDLSPRQRRAVVAMAKAQVGGKRLFCGHFPLWGLPDTHREWQDLAAGRPSSVVDMSLPMLAEPGNPRQAFPRDKLLPGCRVLHRHFGLGTVQTVAVEEGWTNFTVLFDEEGPVDLGLPPSIGCGGAGDRSG